MNRGLGSVKAEPAGGMKPSSMGAAQCLSATNERRAEWEYGGSYD